MKSGSSVSRRSAGFRRRLSKLTVAAIQAVFVASVVLVVPVAAANPSANLDQCANGTDTNSASGCATSDTEWVNGNLGASKSRYLEGDSIPYRLRFGSLSLSSHTVTIEWDTTKSGKHAIDYLTTFNRSVLDANPCLGITGCGSGTFARQAYGAANAIPLDSQVSIAPSRILSSRAMQKRM